MGDAALARSSAGATIARLAGHPLATVVLLAALVVALPFFFPSAYYYRVGTLVSIFALAAIGLNLLMGYAGQVSLGHAGFFGIGAYAVAVLPTHLGVPPLAALLAGAIASGVVAYLAGRPILKLSGHHLAVATLGFGILIWMVLANESRWTGGPDGMPVPRLELFGWRVRGSETWYYIAGGGLVVGAWLALNLMGSSTGRALRAIHDSEVAARMVGVNVAKAKLRVFVVSAVFASIAGSFLALFNGLITPDSASFLRSVELVTMVVVGGMGSVLGSVVGAALITILPQMLTVFHDYEHLMLGLLIMLFMIFLRAGIVPSLRALLLGKAA